MWFCHYQGPKEFKEKETNSKEGMGGLLTDRKCTPIINFGENALQDDSVKVARPVVNPGDDCVKVAQSVVNPSVMPLTIHFEAALYSILPKFSHYPFFIHCAFSIKLLLNILLA